MPEKSLKETRRTSGWMDFAALIALHGLAYLAIAFSLGTLEPIGAVVSGSMEPSLSRGDLVILRNVAPADIRVGDIAQVEIPRAFQEKFGLPPNTLHRIVDIQQTGTNVQFITKGDANSNIDPIPVAPDRVGGVVVGDIPQIGHLFLFLNSPQGRVFALVMAISVIGYILYIGISDNWRNVVVTAQAKAGTLPPESPGLQETQEVTERETSFPASAAVDLRPAARASDERLEDIESGIHETRDSLRLFSAAIAEYGTHLQSHTATVQAMSTASQSLVEAVERQNAVLERLESTLDRQAGIPDSAPTPRRNRRRSNAGETVTGATESPGEASVETKTDAPADDPPAPAPSTSGDKAPRRRSGKRRPTPNAADFRKALRIVSTKRRPRPR